MTGNDAYMEGLLKLADRLEQDALQVKYKDRYFQGNCCNTLQKKQMWTYALALFCAIVAISALFESTSIERFAQFLVILGGALVLALAGYYRPRSLCPASFCPERFHNEDHGQSNESDTMAGAVNAIDGTMAGGDMAIGGQQRLPDLESGPFKHDLFEFYDEPRTCLMSTFLPCVQFGLNYEKVHKDGCLGCGLCYLCCLFISCPWIIHEPFRNHLRKKFFITPTWSNKGVQLPCYSTKEYLLFEDLGVTWFCTCCALIQESREIEWLKQAREGSHIEPILRNVDI